MGEGLLVAELLPEFFREVRRVGREEECEWFQQLARTLLLRRDFVFTKIIIWEMAVLKASVSVSSPTFLMV